jgi:hypothetical protein
VTGDLNRAILGNEVHIGASGECANRFGGDINRYVIKILVVPTHDSAKVLDCSQNPGHCARALDDDSDSLLWFAIIEAVAKNTREFLSSRVRLSYDVW